MKDFPVDRLITETATLRVESLSLGVKRLVLARPDVRNAFDETMIEDLRDVLDHLASIPEAEHMRLLLLTGEGKVFSAGADLAYMKRLGAKTAEESLEDAKGLASLFYKVADFPAPVVAAVQGAAIGGGLGLTVCSDFVLAEEDAIFATSEVRLGIVPGVISPYIVRKLGVGRASPMMLCGARMRAAKARELGLVQRVVDKGSLDEALQDVVLDFLAAGPEAARRTKALLKQCAPLPGPELIELTAEQIASARGSTEGKKGLDAFFAKSPPAWAARVEALRSEKGAKS